MEAYALEVPEVLAAMVETVLPLYEETTPSPFHNLWSAVQYSGRTLAHALSLWAGKFRLTFRGKPAKWGHGNGSRNIALVEGLDSLPLGVPALVSPNRDA